MSNTFEARFDPSPEDLVTPGETRDASFHLPDGIATAEIVMGKATSQEYPDGRWQAFKQRFFPAWLKRFFPVETYWEVSYPFTLNSPVEWREDHT